MAEIVGVRFKRAGKVYYFDPANIELEINDFVVVETSRGQERLVESMIGPEQEIRWSADIRYSDPEMPTGRKEVPGFLVRSTRRRSEVANSHLDWLKLMEG